MASRPQPPAGIYRRFLAADATVMGREWNQAGRQGMVVGQCRHEGCPGLMAALPTHDDGPDWIWYGAQCLACGREVAVRDGRPVLPGSSRLGHMNRLVWQQRLDWLKARYGKTADAAARKEAA